VSIADENPFETKREIISESNISHEQDYYLNEEGLIVFTADFLKKRGYCCGNHCRHCPYTKPEKKR